MNQVIYLLQLEWLKIKYYLPFKLLGGMYLALLPLIMAVVRSMNFPKEMGIDTYFMFPMVWNFVGYFGNWLVYFIMGFMAVLTVTNEYSNRTLRQNIINGISRRDFFLSKLYFILVISVLATAYYIIITMIYGFINTETVFMSRVMENVDMIFRFFLMCFSFMSFGLMLGVLFKQTGISLFLYFAYIMAMERILRFLVIGKLFGQQFSAYAPMNAVNDLTPFPVPKIAKNMTEGGEIKLFLPVNEAILVSTIFTALFLYIAYRLLQTRDL